jgi:hypothetical protein
MCPKHGQLLSFGLLQLLKVLLQIGEGLLL